VSVRWFIEQWQHDRKHAALSSPFAFCLHFSSLVQGNDALTSDNPNPRPPLRPARCPLGLGEQL
jgi:hypothetical protein